MSSLTLEKFECDGEAGSVGARCERWKRGLSIYLEAADINASSKKRAGRLRLSASKDSSSLEGGHLLCQKCCLYL